jgi:predicted amidophosphoribosyltransferase
MKCPKCSTEYNDSFNFCPECKEPNPNKERTNKCPKCGSEYDSSFKFCPECAEANPIGEATVVSPPEAKQPVSSDKKRRFGWKYVAVGAGS